ncbi:JHY protein, partial [Alectura lathami]|nr:JHY protein [Alectura lathami]
DSQESDSESLVEEKHYQLELQQRIRENEELVGLCADEMENDSLEEDSLEETMSLKEQEVKCDTVQYTKAIRKKESNEREQQSADKYFSLRYNPNWKNTKEAVKFSEVEKTHEVAGQGSVDFSQDSFYLHSSGSPEEKNQWEAKFQDSFVEFGTELPSFHEPNAFISSEPFRLHTRRMESSDGCYFRDSPNTYSSAFCVQIREDRSQRAKKNFVEKNKRTLGLHTDKRNSYLQLHNKKQGEVFQEQVADTKIVDEEPAQSVLSFQNKKMDPEHKWYLKSQQLKDHQNKWSQRNQIKSNQNPKRRAFPASDNQQPPGRPAEPKPWHHRHHPMSEFHTAPKQAAEQHNSSALQKRLCPNPSVGPNTDTAANSDTCLNNFPNSRHHAYTSKKSKQYQHSPPNGLPHKQQHLYSHVTMPFFPRHGSIGGQAHPNQNTFNANYQEMVKDQVSLQDCKRHIYADKSYQNYAGSSSWIILCTDYLLSYLLYTNKDNFSFLRPSQSSLQSSPAALCTASQLTQTVKQQHQEMSRLGEAHLSDDKRLFSPLPPIIPQVESDSGVLPERGEGNQVEIRRSNSEGYLMQKEKQKQCKVYKKGRQTKLDSNTFINLNVTLGGLGPDYEAIKEKKEKVKQQKEYAKRIKEHNMKNIALVQRLPTKPQVVSSVSRQKALEYAKKIPRPKIFTARQSDEEVKEEIFLLPTLKVDSLPPIASLEALQSRHEMEKQVVAAFRMLHIL